MEPASNPMHPLAALALLLLAGSLAASARGATWVVAESGGDFTSIQAALDVAMAGDTVEVREKPTPYFEKLVFPRSGNAVDGPIVLRAAPGERPVLDGTGVAGAHMVRIEDRSFVEIIGFEIRNHLNVRDGSGIRVLGAGSDIVIRDNEIHDIRGRDAMGITVYGTKASPIRNLVIDGNTIRDCEPARSEALTLNGNVTDFAVTNNVVRDVNNIGIDFIGGETDIQPDPTRVARNGVCRGNRVERARSSYGGGFAAGIYVDGGRDIVIEQNVVTGSDLGIEVGAENPGTVTRGIVVRDNFVHANEKAGIVFGGFEARAGRVRECRILNNSLFGNDTLAEGFGELWIQFAEQNEVRNNVFHASGQPVLLFSEQGNVDNVLDHNVWWLDGPRPARFEWNGTVYEGLAAYRTGAGQDASSRFADPRYVDAPAGDLHLAPGSPAVDAGDPTFVPAPGETDIDGGPRVNGAAVDAGADETASCGDGVVQLPELCDDGNAVSGDGCDANCTPTGCGNAIVTAGEECDDGNTRAGDCCGATCAFEPSGAACSDGNGCSHTDVCDGAGACAGTLAPAPGCREAGRSSLVIRNQTRDARDLLDWRWTRGAATSVADLGDPAGGGTAYDLCVFDTSAGAPHLVHRARIAPGGTCRGRPCWKAQRGGARGYRYADREARAGGIQSLALKPGAAGRAAIRVRARGEGVAPPALPLAQDPLVTIQLGNGSVCWASGYTAPARRNEPGEFRDETR